jgi:protein gp37
MGQNSKIEWCTHTANLWWGCTKVTAGCDHCYAETLSNRYSKTNVWGNDAPRRIIESVWEALDKYQNAAKKAGEMHRVFVGSMMDIFEKPMPIVHNDGLLNRSFDTGHVRQALFEAIDRGKYNNLMFLFLTKRPSNILKMIPKNWIHTPRKNVMYGTSPCDQKTYDSLMFGFRKVEGKKFLSIEPLLGPIKLNVNPAVDWVIVGGESGPGKRPMDLAWARSIRDQCLSAGVPFFMKQIDKVQTIPDDLMIRQFPI